MDQPLAVIFPFYGIALGLLIGLVIEAIATYKNRAWSIPALAVYGTTFIWYFMELAYTPENFQAFSQEILENCYLQIMLFLGCFRLLLPALSNRLIRSVRPSENLFAFDPARLLTVLVGIWVMLLLYGISRTNGNIVAALLPIASRTGGQMWERAAAAGAGPTGFIVSTASYLYLLICSFFGTLLPLQTKPFAKWFNGLIFLMALPYYILLGARNQLLAVVFPAYFSYALFSRHKWWVKLLITAFLFVVLNQVLTLIITYRNVGFGALLDGSSLGAAPLAEKKHLGLNMLEELCYVNTFYREGILHLSYGGRYLAELANVIPRAIWPGKPLIGIDYALLRGFGGGSSDIGVVATIATGFLGQGIVNFGPFFGAIAPAFLLALWAALLSRLWVQSQSSLRLCLFLAGLGVTFNLGRDITLLVLFPIVFGYGLVRLLEAIGKKRSPRTLAPQVKRNAS